MGILICAEEICSNWDKQTGKCIIPPEQRVKYDSVRCHFYKPFHYVYGRGNGKTRLSFEEFLKHADALVDYDERTGYVQSLHDFVDGIMKGK